MECRRCERFAEGKFSSNYSINNNYEKSFFLMAYFSFGLLSFHLFANPISFL
jgi:hypothetical protein